MAKLYLQWYLWASVDVTKMCRKIGDVNKNWEQACLFQSAKQHFSGHDFGSVEKKCPHHAKSNTPRGPGALASMPWMIHAMCPLEFVWGITSIAWSVLIGEIHARLQKWRESSLASSRDNTWLFGYQVTMVIVSTRGVSHCRLSRTLESCHKGSVNCYSNFDKIFFLHFKADKHIAQHSKSCSDINFFCTRQKVLEHLCSIQIIKFTNSQKIWIFLYETR